MSDENKQVDADASKTAGDGKSLVTQDATQKTNGDGAAADWRAALPEDMRALDAIKDYKDLPGLVKSHVHLQTMVGKDKIVMPGKDAKPDEWNAFYQRLGRPEKPEEYGLPDMKFPNGATLPAETKAHFMAKFHEAGLTKPQAEKLWKETADYEGQLVTKRTEAVAQSRKEALEGLKTEYGAAYDEKLNHARVAVTTFGSPEMKAWLDATGLGDDPNFIKFFANIGGALLEDKAVGGGGTTFTKTPGQASSELDRMKKDPDVLKKLADRNHPDHKATMQEWTRLHELQAAGQKTS